MEAMEEGRSNDIMDLGLWKALTAGDAKFIEEVVQTDKTRLRKVTIDGNSALHIAAKHGYVEIARQVISEAQPSLLMVPNKSGDTPLHLASAAGHPEIVTLLIHQHGQLRQHHRPSSGGVEEDVATIANKIGNTALHAATIGGYLSIVELLLKAAPKLATMNNGAGVSALYMAAERGLLEIARRILQESPEVVSHAGPRGQTALHAAVLRRFEISKMILDKSPSCLKHQDESKSTPLHFAAAGGYVAILQLLLKQDATAGYMQDEEGFTIIYIAASAGNLNMIKEILVHCPHALEQKNDKGSNFVHVAVEKKNLKVVEYLLKSSPSAKELINEQNHEGNTPFHLAVLSSDWKMIRALLRSQANIALVNNSGFTPMDRVLESRRRFGSEMDSLMASFTLLGVRFSTQRADHIRKNRKRIQDETTKLQFSRAYANNLSVVAVLIATVTFAAAFTLPGGYNSNAGSDELGMAILSSRASFKAFLISDTLAMASSMIIAIICLFRHFPHRHFQQQSVATADWLVWVAVGFLCVAFATGVYSVVAPVSEWVAILVILIVCSVPFVVIGIAVAIVTVY